jgi:UDP-N-acetylglucosamine 2-epimerase (non-hydrolysing)
MKSLLIVFGTRPECIKLAPLIQALDQNADFQIQVCHTGQHLEMVEALIDFFNLKIDHRLEVMNLSTNLSELTAHIQIKLSHILTKTFFDYVIVQGDTTTAYAAAISAFYHQIPIIHIEAGLRSFNMHSPFPEEFNRVTIGKIAQLHFAPTVASEQNLLSEGVNPKRIFVTGNTGIDTLFYARSKLHNNPDISEAISTKISTLAEFPKMILVTLHRRENFLSHILSDVLKDLVDILNHNPDTSIIIPQHLNPNVRERIRISTQTLKNSKQLLLLEPLNYPELIYVMEKCYLIVTDSGGIQEEGPSFNKPILVARSTTERPEGIAAGCSKLLNLEKGLIYHEIEELLTNPILYQNMINIENPYGNGKSVTKILEIIKNN